jgi:excisionase family DNA binding protein
MESRKRASHHEDGSIKEKLDKLAEDVKKLPQERKAKLQEAISQQAFSPQAAAVMLGVSLSTIRRLMKTGEFKFFRIGTKRIRIAAEEIDRFRNSVTLGEAAKVLGVNGITIRRLIKSGRLHATRIGRPYRIAMADIEAIMQSDKSKDKDLKDG